MNRDEIAAYSASERLRDQRPVTIRAIRPDDGGLLIEALRTIGPESLTLRFFVNKAKFTEPEVKEAVGVDFTDVVALVAVMREGGKDRIVGGGRYFRLPESGGRRRAEVAFLIDDRHQGMGIGSRLFSHLVAIARASGIDQFVADVLPANEGMLRLFSRSGLPIERTATPDAVHLTIDLGGELTSSG